MLLLPKAASGFIRPSRESDLEELMALWQTSTTFAHPFIHADYWQQSAQQVRDSYLPRAQTWVYQQAGRIVGFISVLDQRYLGALFVAHARHGHGVGHALMAYVQQRYRWLALEVYQQNLRACAFYRKHGFQPVERLYNQETAAYTLIMHWSANASSSP
ncbi:TPA: N-acetyltransferase [Serratia odorifera]|nr:N-acetyltransferase [Serratia odorifera]